MNTLLSLSENFSSVKNKLRHLKILNSLFEQKFIPIRQHQRRSG